MNKLEKGIKVLQILNSNSFEGYIVGGAVRDYLLGNPLNDIDITTNASLDDISKMFDNVEMKGSKYLGCRIIYLDEEFEVTMFRKDIEYIDHRHPTTVVAETIEQDLVRRDFTINAFAMNSDYEIIDLFNGKEDLSNRLIKTIGDANVRFNEDALRVLRALYFSSKLNFDLDNQIIECFNQDYLKYLKEEYIKDMFFKILSFESKKGLEYIVKYNVFKNHSFYQRLAELAFKYDVYDNLYALYILKNGELPSMTLITKKEKSKALDINYLISNEFNNISLFYGNMDILEEAILLWNKISDIKCSLEDITSRYERLAIHNIKEINFDFNLIDQSRRSDITKEIVINILNGNVKNNNNDEIKNFLGVV